MLPPPCAHHRPRSRATSSSGARAPLRVRSPGSGDRARRCAGSRGPSSRRRVRPWSSAPSSCSCCPSWCLWPPRGGGRGGLLSAPRSAPSHGSRVARSHTRHLSGSRRSSSLAPALRRSAARSSTRRPLPSTWWRPSPLACSVPWGVRSWRGRSPRARRRRASRCSLVRTRSSPIGGGCGPQRSRRSGGWDDANGFYFAVAALRLLTLVSLPLAVRRRSCSACWRPTTTDTRTRRTSSARMPPLAQSCGHVQGEAVAAEGSGRYGTIDASRDGERRRRPLRRKSTSAIARMW